MYESDFVADGLLDLAVDDPVIVVQHLLRAASASLVICGPAPVGRSPRKAGIGPIGLEVVAVILAAFEYPALVLECRNR